MEQQDIWTRLDNRASDLKDDGNERDAQLMADAMDEIDTLQEKQKQIRTEVMEADRAQLQAAICPGSPRMSWGECIEAVEKQAAENNGLRELLREARDTVQASTVEDGITEGRRDYRQDLHKRLAAALTK